MESTLVMVIAPSPRVVTEPAVVGSVAELPPEVVPVPAGLSVPEETVGDVPPELPAVTPPVPEPESLSTVEVRFVSLVAREVEVAVGVSPLAPVGAAKKLPFVPVAELSVVTDVVDGEDTVMLGTSTGGGGGGVTIAAGAGTVVAVTGALVTVVDEPEETEEPDEIAGVDELGAPVLVEVAAGLVVAVVSVGVVAVGVVAVELVVVAGVVAVGALAPVVVVAVVAADVVGVGVVVAGVVVVLVDTGVVGVDAGAADWSAAAVKELGAVGVAEGVTVTGGGEAVLVGVGTGAVDDGRVGTGGSVLLTTGA